MKNVRSLMFGFGLLSFLGCATNRFKLDELSDERNFRYSKSLEVNSVNIDRVVTRKNEKRGVMDLIRIAESSVLEDSWAYIPKHCLWIEIGKDEKLEVLNGAEKNIPSPYLNKHYQDLVRATQEPFGLL